MPVFTNPYKPGAGHMPPYLAGRDTEQSEFKKLLGQSTILNNLVLTGLRGVGKTVLLDTFKPIGVQAGWLWVGADISEATTLTEERLATRLITDLSVGTSTMVVGEFEQRSIGFFPTGSHPSIPITLGYDTLMQIYNQAPGLVADKLKAVLEFVWPVAQREGRKGIVFAYDESQNLADHATSNEYPLSLLLDVFQSIQKKGVPFMLVLTGLPTLFPKLVEARTFAERMFRIMTLDQLDKDESRQAILKPLEDEKAPFRFDEQSVRMIIERSGGYPYFIQFICREVYDVWIQRANDGQMPSVPLNEIVRKLDSDFFAGRWSKVTDRQRELLTVIAALDNCDEEFTVQEVVERSKQDLDKPFSSSHVNQMLSTLINAGLIYKNRYGKYCFAVPLLGDFIKRQMAVA